MLPQLKKLRSLLFMELVKRSGMMTMFLRTQWKLSGQPEVLELLLNKRKSLIRIDQLLRRISGCTEFVNEVGDLLRLLILLSERDIN